jgi:hypothetical protein
MQTNKLATILMVGAMSMLLVTFVIIQSTYAGGGGHGHGSPPVKPSQEIGSVQQLRLNQPQYPGSTKYVAPQSIWKAEPNLDIRLLPGK